MKHILIVDNYDSFTYNLVHYVEGEDCRVTVIRNDQIELSALNKFDKIILSPGPGLPQDAGALIKVIEHSHMNIPLLGVCLGHQAIALAFGAALKRLPQVTHGVGIAMRVVDHQEPMFRNMPQEIVVGRYHSWVVDPLSISQDLKITAMGIDGTIMALRHQHHPVTGIQFHPESLLSQHGRLMLRQWLND